MSGAMAVCKFNNRAETVQSFDINLSTLVTGNGSMCWLRDKIGNNTKEYYASKKPEIPFEEAK